MEPPNILHMLSPLPHVSPFDVNMALDAGYDSVVPYTGVELGQVNGLVQDAIFSRGPKRARRTGMFIGGRNAILALDMLAAAEKAMVPPFAVSVLADPAGSFTTAAAMVAKVEFVLRENHAERLADQRVVVFGGTGVLGFSAAVIAAGESAEATLVGYDGLARVAKFAEDARERFGLELGAVDGSSEELKVEALRDATVILCAGRAGTQVLSREQIEQASALSVAADANAVPPAGIEGLDADDDAALLPGTDGLGIGALAIGGVKYQVEAALFRKMKEADTPLMLDFRDAFAVAREIVG